MSRRYPLRGAVLSVALILLSLSGCSPTSSTSVSGLAVSTSSSGSAGLPSPSGTALPSVPRGGLSGRIAYSHEDDIWIMDADGSDPIRLTTHPAADFDPSFSPDGSQIAFRSHRDGDEEIYLMNSGGTGERNISNNPGADWSPAWSPDGRRIAFASQRPGDLGMNIYVMTPDGSDVQNLTSDENEGEYPSWSPDGSRIAFASYQGGDGPSLDYDIFVMNADGSEQRNLTADPAYDMYPAWSPSGELIAFHSDREGWPTLPGYRPPSYEPERHGNMEIFVMSAVGSPPRNLTSNPREDDEFPAWSGDGRLLYTRYGALTVMGREGTGKAQISGEAPSAVDTGGFPDWWQPR